MLSLSQKGAGGDGMHEACNGAFWRYVIGEGMKRQKDSVAQALLDQLVDDYKAMPHGRNGKFFTDKDRGIFPFMIKYLHYCFFGISPFDKEKIDTLYDYYYANTGKTATQYYIKGLAKLVNYAEKMKFNRLLPQVAKIYEESPMFEKLPDSISTVGLSKNEFANMIIPLFSIAAVGPKHLLKATMGQAPFPNQIDGVKTDQIDVLKIWDSINLDDKNEVKRYIFECGRLWVPVGHTRK